MPQPPPSGETPLPPAGDSIDLLAQTRRLRRKVVFWRRAAWLAAGLGGIVAVVLWQRGEQHLRLCRGSLAGYFKEATGRSLANQPAEVLEQDWRLLPPSAGEVLSAYHYNLIVRNWRTRPAEGERLPIAVCGTPHQSLFRQGRHILYSDGAIDWRSDREAQDVIRAAQRDDGP